MRRKGNTGREGGQYECTKAEQMPLWDDKQWQPPCAGTRMHELHEVLMVLK